MGEYIVSARKYRPMTFDSVVGQHALTTTLKNAVKSNKLAHAYLFCGPRGVGKTTCARIFAKTINCEHPREDGESCNECESCKSFNEGRSYNIFELDAASNNSVEDIKSLMDQTRIPPQLGKYKVFIIDEVHMLSQAAFNAFLKTLEEPPAHVIFILATTEKNKILPTILSRCQIYDFERMTVANTIAHLKMVAEKEGYSYEEAALEVIAEKADGGMRDALSIFDQTASFCQGNITYQKVIEDLNVLDAENYFNIVDLAIENKISDIMVLLNNIIESGFDGANIIVGLAKHIRNVMMAKDAATVALLECSEKQKERYKTQAEKCPSAFLYTALKILNRCDINYKNSSNKRLLVELTLIEVGQITQPADADVPGAGRQPHRLKSLFKNIVMMHPKPAGQVAGGATPPVVRTPHHSGASVPASQPQTTDTAAATLSHTNIAAQAAKPAAGPNMNVQVGSVGFTFGRLLNGNKSKAEGNNPLPDSDAADSNGQAEANNNMFSQEELERQWLSMCNRMPKEYVGLAQRLKNATPKITEFPNVEIVVDNDIFLAQINNIANRIRLTLVNDLHNEALKLSVRLAKAEEVKPILTKKQLFEKMKASNKAINMLANELGLVLN